MASRAHVMSKRIAIACCTAALAAAALPSVVLGSKQGQYAGKIKGEPGSEITFKVDRRGNDLHVKVFRFSATNVPTKCGGAPDTTEYSLPGYFGLRIKKGRFHIKDSPTGFRDESLFVLRGVVKGHGKARGTLRIVDDFDVVGVCDTGELAWRAHK